MMTFEEVFVMRIAAHPIIESYNKGKLVTFTLDGKELTGYEGESIAAAPIPV